MMCRPLPDLSAQLGDFERYRRRLGNEVLDSITLLYRRAITRLTEGDGRWTDEDRRLEEQMVGDASIGTFLITQSLLTFVFEDWRMVRELYDKLSAQQEFATVGLSDVSTYGSK